MTTARARLTVLNRIAICLHRPLAAACLLLGAASQAAPALAADPAATAPAQRTEAAPAPEPHALVFLRPDDAPFMPAPGTPACLQMTGLHGDPGKQAASFLIKMAGGCVVPYHWHTPTEEIVIVKGEAQMQMKGEPALTMPIGAYSGLPTRHNHRFRCSMKGECIVFVVADGAFDIHYVDEQGASLEPEQALKAAADAGYPVW